MPFPLSRPRIGSPALSLLVAVYLLFVTNYHFWKTSIWLLHSHAVPLAVLAVGLVCLMTAFCVALSAKYVVKPAFILLVLAAAAGAWFMNRYGTIIDLEMIQSAAETTHGEASDLLTPRFLLYFAAFGIVPSLLVAWVRIDHRTLLPKLAQNSAIIALCLAAAGGCFLAQARTFVSLGREHHEWFATLNPVVPLGNGVRYLVRVNSDKHIVARPLGTDARIADSGRRKPRVLVVVAGETARAESFSLGGYERETTPEIAALGVTYFPQTTSCGTITSVSLPCMFSVYPRQQFTHRKGLDTENVLDVLTHAGVKVAWWDNNTGSKDVADRIDYTPLDKDGDPALCANGECIDAILLTKLDAWLDNVKGDSVLVLHQLGSHGPAYLLRYPEAFRRFVPDCRNPDFANCSQPEIQNAYDNTILYTDHILAEVIRKLAAREGELSTSMLYMSDHGESLGEFGLYLHGTPYFMAPAQQTHVPYLMWFGQDDKSQLSPACLTAQTRKAQSHDNLFHTMLGMMRIETSVYDKALDTLAECRPVQKPEGIVQDTPAFGTPPG